jgi:hypothetical protein
MIKKLVAGFFLQTVLWALVASRACCAVMGQSTNRPDRQRALQMVNRGFILL